MATTTKKAAAKAAPTVTATVTDISEAPKAKRTKKAAAPAPVVEVIEEKVAPVKVLPELPTPAVTVQSVHGLFQVKRDELLANIQALSLAEHIDRDVLRSFNLHQCRDIVRAAIHRIDHELEIKATSGEASDVRTKGDIDAYIGFTELPKGYRAITAAGTNFPTTEGV